MNDDILESSYKGGVEMRIAKIELENQYLANCLKSLAALAGVEEAQLADFCATNNTMNTNDANKVDGEKCPKCGGTGNDPEDIGPWMPDKCPTCKGTGKEKPTLKWEELPSGSGKVCRFKSGDYEVWQYYQNGWIASWKRFDIGQIVDTSDDAKGILERFHASLANDPTRKALEPKCENKS